MKELQAINAVEKRIVEAEAFYRTKLERMQKEHAEMQAKLQAQCKQPQESHATQREVQHGEQASDNEQEQQESNLKSESKHQAMSKCNTESKHPAPAQSEQSQALVESLEKQVRQLSRLLESKDAELLKAPREQSQERAAYDAKRKQGMEHMHGFACDKSSQMEQSIEDYKSKLESCKDWQECLALARFSVEKDTFKDGQVSICKMSGKMNRLEFQQFTKNLMSPPPLEWDKMPCVPQRSDGIRARKRARGGPLKMN